MKRSIVISILLLFVSASLICISVMYWKSVNHFIQLYEVNFRQTLSWDEFARDYSFYKTLSYAIISVLAAISSLVSIILIAVKDFPVFKPIVDKFTARKEKCAQAKAERTEAKKQAKISELEAQLEELKK